MNNCRLNIAYPEIHIENPNKSIADILTPLYSGPYGELSGISTYLFQSLVTEKRDKYLSEILECIAVVEMKHFRILGRIIKGCGIAPRFVCPNDRGQLQYWSARFSDYETDPSLFIHKNIEEEKYGLKAYRNAYEKIRDKGVQKVLERIMADEEHHIRIFEGLLK